MSTPTREQRIEFLAREWPSISITDLERYADSNELALFEILHFMREDVEVIKRELSKPVIRALDFITALIEGRSSNQGKR